MALKQFVVDAFTNTLFKGNQAAVCVVDKWPGDDLMRQIAAENLFSETAFALKDGEIYSLRWFTPAGEINFCGHATLAAAFVLFNFFEKSSQKIIFETQAGRLTVKKNNDFFVMDFPAFKCNPVAVTGKMSEAAGVEITEAYLDEDLLLILKNEKDVINLNPDLQKLKSLDGLCVAFSAPGKKYDCVSRVFAPKAGINEDPVTGRAHCMITPYWCGRLGKNNLKCFQASKRSGELYTELKGKRVEISGSAVLYSSGEIIPEL